ncbi:hypothetical protein [Mucilaginibacter ginsenosidivorax]|uniref:Uncharacterized protein n=1 Tax=Mucilaginibacter ginsenosidivorax TaxID=862126 RepID=A0A5B8W4N5_9SPHI|nr:hypothetical protein [Mucilaginibacter ginsenosidivorax]QEC78509.1 hypothetical protein FSB76_22095 [Mucilaginibacter ginsenosidivorax]
MNNIRKKVIFKHLLKTIVTIGLLTNITTAFAQTNSTDTSATITADVKNKILAESKDGGRFDFWTPIKGHEYDGQRIQTGASTKDNIYATNREIAVIKWAYALSKSGIKKSDIIGFYEELKGRKIRSDEITLIDFGIKKAAN